MLGLSISKKTEGADLSSTITVNGNLSVNEFNSILQLNNNSTEYYGCNTILNKGTYSPSELTFEFDYINGSVTTGNGTLYAIILDQNDVTVAYKRLQITSFPTSSGVITISFDAEVVIPESGIYQTVIGRRNWNGSSRKVEIFHKDVNSSNGAVWIAYGNSNPSLNVGDTSAVNWSTINKQNFNRIPKALIYKS